MDNFTFRDKEQSCRQHFSTLPSLYHACTPENFEIIFTCSDDFKAAITLFGICVKLFPAVRVFTFEFMNNHIHIVAGGIVEEISAMFALFRRKLGRYLHSEGRYLNLSRFELNFHKIDDLEYFRSAIAYVNRNGFVIDNAVTPFSYQWGANSYYFNDCMKRYCSRCGEKFNLVDARAVFGGKLSDGARGLFTLDGFVSPMSFCDVRSGEMVFRDARHYFYCISRNVESYGSIAKIIGESVFLNDDDLYSVARNLSNSEFGMSVPSSLGFESKLSLARKLHFEYHAGDKQIQRILKLDAETVASLF